MRVILAGAALAATALGCGPGPANEDERAVFSAQRVIVDPKPPKATPEWKASYAAFEAHIHRFNEAVATESKRKPPEVVQLYTQLAQEGNPYAAVRLAQIYERGFGDIAPDPSNAKKWRSVAKELAPKTKPPVQK